MWKLKEGVECPVCKSPVECDDLIMFGDQLIEGQYRCTECGWWGAGYSYGHLEEKIGFVFVTRHKTGKDTEAIITVPAGADRDQAIREIRTAVEHPEFIALISGSEGVPAGVVMDWLMDHDCLLQASALKEYESKVLTIRPRIKTTV